MPGVLLGDRGHGLSSLAMTTLRRLCRFDDVGGAVAKMAGLERQRSIRLSHVVALVIDAHEAFSGVQVGFIRGVYVKGRTPCSHGFGGAPKVVHFSLPGCDSSRDGHGKPGG